MKSLVAGRLAAVAILLALGPIAYPAYGRTSLKSICRVKGQEENTLHGVGIVVGLKGTGDGANSLPTMRALATTLQLMGSPIGSGGAAELKDAKNVALVFVSATVPAAGARRGEKINCSVSAVSAKSLQGGRLLLTPLLGPDPQNPRVYAVAEGLVSLDDPEIPTNGGIHGGCRLEEDFFNVFTKDGKITLVLDENHADFGVAQHVAELINNDLSFQGSGMPLAKALNQVNIEVTIPPQYRDAAVPFVSQILNLPMLEPETGSRVVINERAGSIVFSADVEIGAVAVTHKNMVIETGAAATAANRFVPIDPAQTETPKLKALVEALNAVHAPTEDVIDIIKGLDRNGKLHARLIIE